MEGDKWGHFHHYKEMYERSRSMFNMEVIMEKAGITPGMKVAELGCGPGAFTIPLAETIASKGKIFAVDMNGEALSMLKERLRERRDLEGLVEIIQMPMESTNITGQTIDVVFLANVFHDITDYSLFFKEARRILKSGGRIVDLDWKKTGTGFGPPMNIRLDLEEARSIFIKNGFSVIQEEDMDNDHYILSGIPGH